MTIYKNNNALINKMFINIKVLYPLHWPFKFAFIKRRVHYMASSLLMLCCHWYIVHACSSRLKAL